MSVVAAMARGKYIRLLSADDLLIPGGDEILVQRLQTGGDVFLVPAIRCDIAMSPLRRNPIFRDCVREDPVEFRLTPDPASLEAYARRAMMLEAFVGFMTAVVGKAETWRHIRARTDYFGTCRALGARLIHLLLQNGAIVYMNHYLIRKRGGNGTFMVNGFVARVALAIDGWDRIILEFFKSPVLQDLLYGLLRKNLPIFPFHCGKVSSQNPGDPALNIHLNPSLPFLIRLRHRIKKWLQQ